MLKYTKTLLTFLLVLNFHSLIRSCDQQIPVFGRIYQHYSGTLYQVLTMANHTDRLEELIIYQTLDDQQKILARPVNTFFALVNYEGKIVPRFTLTNFT